MINVSNPVEAAILMEKCTNYVTAFNQMKVAMQDGVNVQGAVSALIGTADMLEVQVDQMRKPEQER